MQGVGNPIYRTPLLHEEALQASQEQLPRKTTSRKLVAKVKDLAKHVVNSRIASSVQTDPTTPLYEEQIEYMAATIHSAIEFAAALDLDRRPRLSRTNAGSVIGSPETNMLDLGIWMSIQAVVTRFHHRRGSHPDALARSVENAWNNCLSPSAFQDFHERLKIVLHCIVDDNGGNSLVERKGGKLFRDCMTLEIVDDDNNEDLEPPIHDDFNDNDTSSTS
ncbi:hypothetical protein IV203_010970 [Nitzschia inconspicua]|uniref:Uncharacterized protein n=1 Tax=Nitzschia inconspicua TaxID=303405 RepID=A0A9K3PL85_9STRA|nr:hypothetical protein IV203_010970 [Nitzschia inconspicua]